MRVRGEDSLCESCSGKLQVTVSAADCRIVSLAPGTTAMLYAAGAGKCLVGTIAHSDEPAEASKVPIVGDAETLDFEQLIALRPTVVVVAVDVVQRVRIDRIRALRIPVYQVQAATPSHSRRRPGCVANSSRSARLTAAGRLCACSTRSGIGLSTRSAAGT